MSLRTIRRGLFTLLVAGAGLLAWSGHAALPHASGHGHPATHLVADGGGPQFPPPPS